MRTRVMVLDVEQLRQRCLMDTFVLGKKDDGLPLRTGQPRISGFLLEPLSHEPGHLMYQEPERRMWIGHGRTLDSSLTAAIC